MDHTVTGYIKTAVSNGRSRAAVFTAVFAFAIIIICANGCGPGVPIFTTELQKDEPATIKFRSLEVSFPAGAFNIKSVMTIKTTVPSSAQFSDEYDISFDSTPVKPAAISIAFDGMRLGTQVTLNQVALLLKTGSGYDIVKPALVLAGTFTLIASVNLPGQIVCGFDADANTTVLDEKYPGSDALPKDITESLGSIGVSGRDITSMIELRMPFAGDVQAASGLIARHLSGTTPFDIQQDVLLSLTTTSMNRAFAEITKKSAGTQYAYSITVDRAFMEGISGSTPSTIASTNGTVSVQSAGTLEPAIMTDITAWLRARERDAALYGIETFAQKTATAIAQNGPGTSGYLLGYAIDRQSGNRSENGIAFLAGKSLFGVRFFSQIELKPSTPVTSTTGKIGGTEDTKELEKISFSIGLKGTDIGKGMAEFSKAFITEHPFREGGPLARIDLRKYGYLGSAVLGFSSNDFDPAKTDTMQFLSFMYFYMYFKTEGGAHSMIATIRNDVSKESIAQSFVPEASQGITMAIEHMNLGVGDESLGYLVRGTLERETMKQDFTAAIVFMRVKSVVTIVNTLNIGPFSTLELSRILDNMRQKITRAF